MLLAGKGKIAILPSQKKIIRRRDPPFSKENNKEKGG